MSAVDSSSGSKSCPLIVAVEGNIGAGKSTFLDYCSMRMNCSVYPEPIDKWENFNGTNVLAKFYGDQSRWAVPFQLLVGMTVRDIYKKKSWKPIRLIERSLLSSRNVFLKHMSNTGMVEPAMFDIMKLWYSQTLKDHEARPHAIVYLRTSPEVSYSRLRARARDSEAAVGLDYLKDLHRLHEEWLAQLHVVNMNYDEPKLQIHTIDANASLNELYIQYDACLSWIELLSEH